MNKQFKDILVGERFSFNNETYTKIEEERVSCCKVLNALQESNNEKVMIKPLDEVVVAQ